ncbi:MULTISPECIES: hypothetical protein [unclassified Mesorhizobium]|nr:MULTISPECIES: hypothetical protein [unclassified Mesorhizobium]
MNWPRISAGRSIFARSFLVWSAFERLGVLVLIIVALWLAVAWAVSLA